jgi:site-specific DNA recombinase
LNRAKIAAALEAGGGSQRPDIDPITLSIEAKLRRAGKGKRLVIANGAEAGVNAGLVELIKDAFTIRIQLLSGSSGRPRDARRTVAGVLLLPGALSEPRWT